MLSLIPPMTQLNTPYPATAYLTGFLRSHGVAATQEDLALKLILDLFSRSGLEAIAACARALPKPRQSKSTRAFIALFDEYCATIAPTIAFLQGHDPTLAHRIASRSFLPEGPRFRSLDVYVDDEGGDPLAWAFGALGTHDRARHFATLYLNDLADVVRDAVDPRFEFVRYAEALAQSQASFDPLADALAAPPNLLEEALSRLTRDAMKTHNPQLVLISVAFPGNMFAALRIAQTIKLEFPSTVIALGGGYVNTELRELVEPRLFDYVDFVTLDDGERPLLCLLEYLAGERSREALQRAFFRDEQGVVGYVDTGAPDVPFAEVGTPTWDGLPLGSYLSLLDMLNPMHRLWSDGRWNKLTIAHGCYWKKCSFCDVSLDYIGRYETTTAALLVDRIQAIVAETGQTGFHFVDEAAPPKILRALAEELIARGCSISWWGNIRFEKSFSPELCRLLARSGCIAISGGLEVASDRLLKLMQKGVSVAQVAQVTRALTEADILVHAYLMYGFPTQTVQDTVDALEYVRQLFAAGCIQSGYFHRFACTIHSPVGKNPEQFGVKLKPLPAGLFARNDVGIIDPAGVDHATLGVGLNKALYNYMHGIGLDTDVRQWFTGKVPRTRVSPQFIERALASS